MKNKITIIIIAFNSDDTKQLTFFITGGLINL
jgi:hypothetical protein